MATKPKATSKPKLEPKPHLLRSTTVLRHNGVKLAAGVTVESTNPMVARFPAFFEPVEEFEDE